MDIRQDLPTGAAAAATWCTDGLESSTSAVGVAIEGEVEWTCPVIGCLWASSCGSVAAGLFMAAARLDLWNFCSTMASSRSFFNSALLAMTRAAYFSQTGRRWNFARLPWRKGAEGVHSLVADLARLLVQRNQETLVHALAQKNSMMAIFARRSSLVMLLEAHVYPSGQLARKGSVGGSTAMAAGGGMPNALSELSPLGSPSRQRNAIPSCVQRAARARFEQMVTALRVRAEPSNFAAVVFYGNDRTQGADGCRLAPSRTCENMFRNRLSNVAVQDSS